MAFAKKNGIPVPVTKEKPYSQDAQPACIVSFEGGELEDPWNEPGPGCHSYHLCAKPEDAPDEPEDTSRVDFKAGNPVAVNGKKMKPAQLIAHPEQAWAASHGVGRLDMVENRFVGMKSHGVYETPGCTILFTSPTATWKACAMDREVMHLRDSPDHALRRDGLLRLLVRARARVPSRPWWTRARSG